MKGSRERQPRIGQHRKCFMEKGTEDRVLSNCSRHHREQTKTNMGEKNSILVIFSDVFNITEVNYLFNPGISNPQEGVTGVRASPLYPEG